MIRPVCVLLLLGFTLSGPAWGQNTNGFDFSDDPFAEEVRQSQPEKPSTPGTPESYSSNVRADSRCKNTRLPQRCVEGSAAPTSDGLAEVVRVFEPASRRVADAQLQHVFTDVGRQHLGRLSMGGCLRDGCLLTRTARVRRTSSAVGELFRRTRMSVVRVNSQR